VAGRRPVEEVFAAGRIAHRLLVVPQRRNALEQLVLHATRLRIPIVEVEGGSLTALAGFDGHQGVALVVDPRRFATLDDVLARAAERDEPPFVLVLDSLEDPQNVGTLLRSAEAAGVHGIVFPTRRQAPLSPAAVKASAGAVEHLLLCPVDDLPGALADLHGHGVRVAGSEADAPLTARQTDLRGPLAIVVGSEGQGLGPAVRRRCDVFMRIPMRGAVGSLNAAVAGSVLLFEAVAQRDPDGRPAAVPRERTARADHLTDPAAGPGPVADDDPTPTVTPGSQGLAAIDGEAENAPMDRVDSEPPEPLPDAETELLPGEGAPAPTPKPKKARAPRTPHA
jgi:23S rRNA (guanosine2251-2'-O)-methyltransferase